jgi:hypothetical protein
MGVTVQQGGSDGLAEAGQAVKLFEVTLAVEQVL